MCTGYRSDIETVRLVSHGVDNDFILGSGACNLCVQKFVVLGLAYLMLQGQVDPEPQSMSTGLSLDQHLRCTNSRLAVHPLQILGPIVPLRPGIILKLRLTLEH